MDFETAKSKAIKYIGISKKTEFEVRMKLKRINVNDEIVDDVISYITELGYINDNEYVDAYIRQNMRLFSMSIYEMKQKLLQKGIKKYIIEEKLDNLYDTDYEKKVIEKLYNTKFKNMDELKIKKYLYSKGFTKDEF